MMKSATDPRARVSWDYRIGLSLGFPWIRRTKPSREKKERVHQKIITQLNLPVEETTQPTISTMFPFVHIEALKSGNELILVRGMSFGSPFLSISAFGYTRRLVFLVNNITLQFCRQFLSDYSGCKWTA